MSHPEDKDAEKYDQNEIPDWEYIDKESKKLLSSFLKSYGLWIYGSLGATSLGVGSFLGWFFTSRRLGTKNVPTSSIKIAFKALLTGTALCLSTTTLGIFGFCKYMDIKNLDEFRLKVSPILSKNIGNPLEGFFKKHFAKTLHENIDVDLEQQLKSIESSYMEIFHNTNLEQEINSLLDHVDSQDQEKV